MSRTTRISDDPQLRDAWRNYDLLMVSHLAETAKLNRRIKTLKRQRDDARERLREALPSPMQKNRVYWTKSSDPLVWTTDAVTIPNQPSIR